MENESGHGKVMESFPDHHLNFMYSFTPGDQCIGLNGYHLGKDQMELQNLVSGPRILYCSNPI